MTARRKRSLPYETVKAAIHQRIAEGGWQPGVRLPSERELVLQFGCARMTVHRALRELEAEGLIERRQGSGSYVAELHPISKDRKSTRLNSSHTVISYAVFCLKKKNQETKLTSKRGEDVSKT